MRTDDIETRCPFEVACRLVLASRDDRISHDSRLFAGMFRNRSPFWMMFTDNRPWHAAGLMYLTLNGNASAVALEHTWMNFLFEMLLMACGFVLITCFCHITRLP